MNQIPEILREPTRSASTCHNFSAGPGALPVSVLQEAAEAIHQLPGTPLSVLGISHRSKWFSDLVDELESNLRELIGVSGDFSFAFLQGGGSLQFTMIPMNFLRGRERPAAYIDSGYWSQKAIPEARIEGPVEVLWSGKSGHYRELPGDEVFQPDRPFSYLHYISNETVEGLQFFREPPVHPGTSRIVDMSSDFLSRPIHMDRYDMIYAHAQKNLGPAGVSVCLIHKRLLDLPLPPGVPAILDYRNHIRMRSAYNTPPVFAIYVVLLVTRWLRDEIGGLAAMEALNREKADLLYQLIDDDSTFYSCPIRPVDRSIMNIAFRLKDPELEPVFLQESEQAGLHGLKGHRSVGGLRASLYNPVTLEAVHSLVVFMKEFRRRYG